MRDRSGDFEERVLDHPENAEQCYVRHGNQQHASGGLAIAMMPPMTRKASTSTSSAAITSFVLVSMGGRMMHKVALPGSGCDAAVRCGSSTAGSISPTDPPHGPQGPEREMRA